MTPPYNFLRRFALVCCAAATARAVPMSEETKVKTFHDTVQPILVKYCFDCHGDGAKKGQVSFDEFSSNAEMMGKTKLWLAALKNVRAGMMPPPTEDVARPTAAEVKELENWIKFAPFDIDPEKPDPGRVTVRRLNRVEYRNTIRDLMGTEFNSEVEFPPDDTGHGFDNIGEVLTVSPLLMEKYLQAAEEIVDKAVPRVGRVPIKRTFTGRDFKKEEPAVVAADSADKPATPARGGGRGGRNVDLNVRKAGKLTRTFTLKEAGAYSFELKADVKSTFDFDAGRATLIVAVDDQEKSRQEIVWGSKPVRISSENTWSEGDHRITVEIQPLEPVGGDAVKPEPVIPPAEVAVVPAPLPPVLPGAVIANAGATPGTPAATPPAAAREQRARPPVARSVDFSLTAVEVLGPLDKKSWVPPENYRRFFAEDVPTEPEARDAFARKVIRDFAERAFRRPVEDAKVNQLAGIARNIYSQPGKKFEDGVAHAMMGVLASPRFLFRVEDAAPAEASEKFAAIDEYALASRLSYFLWSTMPDEELFGLAKKGELRQQLPAQIARMLKDSKSQAFVKNFPGQWLQARDIETVEINARAVLGLGDIRANVASPVDLNAALRKNMRSETEMYFDYVLREDRSVLEFIESDYAFLNAKLATHYGVKDVTGDDVHRVTLPADSPRGGMLTQGTVLAVTSNPTRTSPVKRGLFVLENFLGTPPPPPPPDIPPLDEAAKSADGRILTQREALAAHREKPLCASCHARMDPLGFALENFNAMGNWRDVDMKQPIDASGKLATGEPFANIQELKRILTHERRLDYYRCLTEKMLTYALGRSLDYHDVYAVDQIVIRLEQNEGRFSALLNGIIESTPFQKQRNLKVPAATVSTSSPSASAVAQASFH